MTHEDYEYLSPVHEFASFIASLNKCNVSFHTPRHPGKEISFACTKPAYPRHSIVIWPRYLASLTQIDKPVSCLLIADKKIAVKAQVASRRTRLHAFTPTAEAVVTLFSIAEHWWDCKEHPQCTSQFMYNAQLKRFVFICVSTDCQNSQTLEPMNSKLHERILNIVPAEFIAEITL